MKERVKTGRFARGFTLLRQDAPWLAAGSARVREAATPRQDGKHGFAGFRSDWSFTLVELLCAMAILSIMAIGLTMIFADSDRAWILGTDRAEINTAGRAALNMIVHDLEYAVADDVISFAMFPDTNVVSYGFTNSEIRFVTLENDSKDGSRTAREMYYYVERNPDSTNRFRLMRGYWDYQGDVLSDPLHCYSNMLWYLNSPLGAGRPDTNTAMIADNVCGLSFYATTSSGNVVRITNQYYSLDPPNNRPDYMRLPDSVDVYFELLSDSDVQELENRVRDGMPTKNCIEFLEQKVRRFSTRAHFYNRNGYKTR